MLIFMPALFSRPVLALMALAAVALLIPAVVGPVLRCAALPGAAAVAITRSPVRRYQALPARRR
jgi:hypothetical protein